MHCWLFDLKGLCSLFNILSTILKNPFMSDSVRGGNVWWCSDLYSIKRVFNSTKQNLINNKFNNVLIVSRLKGKMWWWYYLIFYWIKWSKPCLCFENWSPVESEVAMINLLIDRLKTFKLVNNYFDYQSVGVIFQRKKLKCEYNFLLFDSKLLWVVD